MATGLGLLGLAPSHFWSMTPRELAAATRGALGSSAPDASLSRSDFDRLQQRFPDR
ncbi:MAG: phage tail assembly chaperone [Hyphomicrobiaceae bacterium]